MTATSSPGDDRIARATLTYLAEPASPSCAHCSRVTARPMCWPASAPAPCPLMWPRRAA